jgi:hypothetical protein
VTAEADATIAIGGRLSRRLAAALASKLLAEGAGEDWGASFGGRDDVLACMERSAAAGEPFTAVVAGATYGRPRNVERFCMRHRLVFRVTCNSIKGDEGDGEHAFFDGRKLHELPGDEDGNPMIPVSEVMAAFAEERLPELRERLALATAPVPPIVLAGPAPGRRRPGPAPGR